MIDRGTVVELAPTHEKALLDGEVEVADESVQMVLNVKVDSAQNPQSDYWEVTYLTATPNTDFGETRMISEELINQHQQTEETETESDQYCIEFSDSPNNKWEEMKEQRAINNRRVSSSKAQAWAGQRSDSA